MTTIADTRPDRRITTSTRSRPLLSVMLWEVRRLRASRLFWIQALCFFCLLVVVTWFGRAPYSFTLGGIPGAPNVMFSGFVAGTSAWGLMETLPPATLLLLVFLLPFVNADGVTRDLQRRTHELLMATTLPNRAYVWGRYLMGLLVSLGLALLLLAAILGTGLLLHLTVTNYPAPEIGNVLTLWVGMVVPATILVSSLSFALGTSFPRLTTLVKVAILVGWFIGAEILPHALLGDMTSPPAWYSAWDPTSAVTAQGMILQYNQAWPSGTATSAAQLQQTFLAVENSLPGIGAWLAPHLIEALLSLVLVVLAAFTFQRFRNAFGE